MIAVPWCPDGLSFAAEQGDHSYDEFILRSTVCMAEIELAIGSPARMVDSVCNEA